MALTFFGLRPEDKEALILEPAFALMYYGGFLWRDIYNLPVSYKRWFIERINKEITRSSETGSTQSHAAHHNSPDMRELEGKSRGQAPSRLKRFT